MNLGFSKKNVISLPAECQLFKEDPTIGDG